MTKTKPSNTKRQVPNKKPEKSPQRSFPVTPRENYEVYDNLGTGDDGLPPHLKD